MECKSNAYATCNYVKPLFFFYIKNEYYFVSNLFKIYLASETRMWKKAQNNGM
jgi:Gpi18-like mannosyltransferase